MLKLKNNIVLKVAMTVCIIMQLAVLFPHHHHSDSPAACINPFHCLTEHVSDNFTEEIPSNEKCCSHHTSNAYSEHSTCDHDSCNHSHDGESYCRFTQLDVAAPEREQLHDAILSGCGLLHLLPFLETIVPEAGYGRYFGEVVTTILKNKRDIEPVHTLYISRAIPARAPAQIV